MFSPPLTGGGKGAGDINNINMCIKEKAKKLRKNLTDEERILWAYLRNKGVNGVKFRRQEPIGRYIVDFVCYEQRLVVEIDGSQHAEAQRRYDLKRDNYLRGMGYNVVRFWNSDVKENLEGVIHRVIELVS
jgi:very-short-patch-repair endonuclease